MPAPLKRPPLNITYNRSPVRTAAAGALKSAPKSPTAGAGAPVAPTAHAKLPYTPPTGAPRMISQDAADKRMAQHSADYTGHGDFDKLEKDVLAATKPGSFFHRLKQQYAHGAKSNPRKFNKAAYQSKFQSRVSRAAAAPGVDTGIAKAHAEWHGHRDNARFNRRMKATAHSTEGHAAKLETDPNPTVAVAREYHELTGKIHPNLPYEPRDLEKEKFPTASQRSRYTALTGKPHPREGWEKQAISSDYVDHLVKQYKAGRSVPVQEHAMSIVSRITDMIGASPLAESVGDRTKGAWRKKGGKFSSINAKGGAVWQPHIPKALRAHVESMGAKVKPSGTGGGLALVFETHEKALEAFKALVAEGHQVAQHTIPGILLLQPKLEEGSIYQGPYGGGGGGDQMGPNDSNPNLMRGATGFSNSLPAAVPSDAADIRYKGPAKARNRPSTTDRPTLPPAAAPARPGLLARIGEALGEDFHQVMKDKSLAKTRAAMLSRETGRQYDIFPTADGDFVVKPTVAEDILPGGKGDKKSDADFDPEQIEMGMKVEMEHTSDPAVAREIVHDHLTEHPKYYSKLKKSGLADELAK
jgi:hypothetical protein